VHQAKSTSIKRKIRHQCTQTEAKAAHENLQ